MIISRTPLRLSLCGGGSDLSAYYRQESGAVVSTAIDKYIYITVNRKFDRRIRASYSLTEIVDTVDELQHELIREALRLVGIDGGVEITSISDIPSQGTGLGSSSTYTVGLLHALYAYRGQHVSAERLAREACRIEIDVCGKPIGKQDQYIAAYGGLQHIQFNPDESVYVDPIICTPDALRSLHAGFLLFYTGVTRSADAILTEQTRNVTMHVDARVALRTMVKLADELREALTANDVSRVGDLLHRSWVEKRKLASNVTNSQLDLWYETARRHGATGGKITGAGGGGFLLLWVPGERRSEIVAALPELRSVPFRFEPQGSKIIYVEETR